MGIVLLADIPVADRVTYSSLRRDVEAINEESGEGFKAGVAGRAMGRLCRLARLSPQCPIEHVPGAYAYHGWVFSGESLLAYMWSERLAGKWLLPAVAGYGVETDRLWLLWAEYRVRPTGDLLPN